MTISYNWLSEYLPVKIEPEKLSKILTSIGLEVESLEKYESIPGSLKGLVVGEVIECIQHPNADKLKLTKVNIGGSDLLKIVCGAPNVASGQKVIVAQVGVTIHPLKSEPITMKVAKIRGEESYGMICAEDEIGLGESHAGIFVLPDNLKTGSFVADYFKPYEDFVYEIGLTPNHMDAMSHFGVARDVCAYLSHHENKEYRAKNPSVNNFKAVTVNSPISVTIENTKGCQRYSAILIKGIKIAPSPKWMQDKLKAIGVRPINNIVDITNYVLHETGQPLHAFDADEIRGEKIIVKNLSQGTPFITLDEKERKLNAEDLMICDAEGPICIAGVFGGLKSGVKDSTQNIFLESAWFNPNDVRKTSIKHGLRTDAAAHFEKGMDISNTVNVLKRAASLIKELAGGEITSSIVDVYPKPNEKTQIALKYHYLKKLSGKNYHPDTVKAILLALGFEMVKEGMDDVRISVPFHKPDITLPADVVEEIMRIDGYDNIQIPSSITISPSVETDKHLSSYKEKISNYLVAVGFNEIFTNSITNSAYFTSEELEHAVKMINNLSAELNIMRPSLLETGLESIAHNLNRKNANLRFFEFGKTYSTSGTGKYEETNHLCLYTTGKLSEDSWKGKSVNTDFYYLKGLCNTIIQLTGMHNLSYKNSENPKFETGLSIHINNQLIAEAGVVKNKVLQVFDIKPPVFFADFNWDLLSEMASKNNIEFKELPKQLPVHRDLSLVIDKTLAYIEVEKTIQKVNLDKLQQVELFDVFENEKLGANKKSIAVSFSFLDEEKTLTDKEVDTMMSRITTALERDLSAEIRK
ncbi:MAG: phenylalanine--tRNA ligase subunit beta [Bacteroidetes bacterium]|nr:phenylalanine--tRNA ligase subunit beta [Bacteroidota bacterium]